MISYQIKPIRKVRIAELVRILEEKGLPYESIPDGKSQTVTLGADKEFSVHLRSGRFTFPKATITLKFEDPELKGVLSDWMDACGLDAPEEFFTWHAELSPNLLDRVQQTWGIQLAELEAVPVELDKNVLVFLLPAASDKLLSEQLAAKPHRDLRDGEYVRAEVFEVDASEDPFDTTVYQWEIDGSSCLAIRSSAPIQTFLSLWRLTDDESIETNIEGRPNKAIDGDS